MIRDFPRIYKTVFVPVLQWNLSYILSIFAVMEFYEKYIVKSTLELVKVMEQPANFQPAVLTAVQEIIKSRNEPYENLVNMAKSFQNQQIIRMLNELDPLNDELKLPPSHFLSKSEMKEMLVTEFEKLIAKKDGFRFDVWKYSIGGI